MTLTIESLTPDQDIEDIIDHIKHSFIFNCKVELQMDLTNAEQHFRYKFQASSNIIDRASMILGIDAANLKYWVYKDIA